MEKHSAKHSALCQQEAHVADDVYVLAQWLNAVLIIFLVIATHPQSTNKRT
jgi:hypothetical protein